MWFKAGDTTLDLSDVSNVTFERNARRVIVTMKSGQQINCVAGENVTPEGLYESITSLLESMTDRDDRYRENTFELFKRTLSELEKISQSLRRLPLRR